MIYAPPTVPSLINTFFSYNYFYFLRSCLTWQNQNMEAAQKFHLSSCSFHLLTSCKIYLRGFIRTSIFILPVPYPKIQVNINHTCKVLLYILLKKNLMNTSISNQFQYHQAGYLIEKNPAWHYLLFCESQTLSSDNGYHKLIIDHHYLLCNLYLLFMYLSLFLCHFLPIQHYICIYK